MEISGVNLHVTFASSKKSEQLVNLLKGKNKFAVFIHGDTGTGKTFTVKTLAKELGYKLIDSNSSTLRNKEELEKIHEQVQSESFEKVIYLFDEAETVKDFKTLEFIVRDSHYPIFIITHIDHKIPPAIKRRCQTFKTQKPNLTNLVEVVKKVGKEHGIEPDFSRIIPGVDFRTAINCALYHSESFKEETIFEQVNKIMTLGAPGSSNLIRGLFIYENVPPIWLIDNLPNFFHGRRMVEQMELIANADLIKDNIILKYGHRSTSLYARTETPYYVKRSYMVNKKNGGSK